MSKHIHLPNNWKDPNLLQTLEELTLKCQSEEFRRDELDKSVFQDLWQILEISCKERDILAKPGDDDLKILIEIFRFLRNSVANCKENQEEVGLRTGILTVCLDFLGESSKKEVGEITEACGDGFLIAVRCCLQALGNLLVDNADIGGIIKGQLDKTIYPLLKSSCDDKIIQYSAMILHLFCKVHGDFTLEIDLSVIPKLLENTNLEFVVFVLESLAVSDAFTSVRFQQLDPETRVRFINFLIAHEEVHVRCSPSITEFYGHRFELKSDLILKSQLQDDSLTCWEISCLLELLCCMTASTDNENVSSSFQTTSLLTTSVCLLKAVHELGKQNPDCSYHAPIHKLEALRVSDDTESMRSQPTFLFKAHLIRLIANLVHGNFDNQELVRSLEGISIILDCCQIDARNPFITQWAVLAIRNLCEGNSANQDLIDKVQKIDTDSKINSSNVKLIG